SPQAGAVAHIQEGINLVDASGTVQVIEGTYVEDIIADKAVSLLGPNAGISPNTGSRVPEAVIHPATSSPFGEIIKVQASDVSIDGFLIDGDNPGLTSGFLGTNGADLDAAEAVTVYVDNVNNLTVQNNDIRNLTYFGVTIFGDTYSAPATSGHLVDDNRFADLGTYDAASGIDYWGGGVLLYNDQYARVTNNVMTNVRIGIQTGNFSDPNPGGATYQVISDNEMSVRRRGIFHNLFYSSASAYSLINNTITGIADANETVWDGILLSSLSVPSTTQDNSIDGTGISLPSEGIEVWNVDAGSPATIIGGSVTAVETGLFVNNYDGYNSNAGDGAHATVSGLSITPNATGIGIRLFDNPAATGNADVQLDIQSGVTVTGGTTGLQVENETATVLGLSDLSFNGTTGNYIELLNSANDMDATGVSFDGLTGTTGTQADNFAIEDKVLHGIDDGALGFVTVLASHAFVTPNSFIAPATTEADVQRGVDVAADAWTINIQSASYAPAVTVPFDLTFDNDGATTLADLTMDGAAKTLTLADAFTIGNSLTLTEGIIATDASNLLTLTDAATTAGGSATSYVQGPLAKEVNTALTGFAFPVGKGNNYRPAILTLDHTGGTTTYTVEMNNTAPGAYTPPAGVINSVSTVRHWTVEASGPGVINNAAIELFYDLDLPSDNVSNPNFVRIVKDDGAGNWVNLGGTGTAAGTGSISSTINFTSLSEFALAIGPLDVIYVHDGIGNDANTGENPTDVPLGTGPK
ncbi:MAG: hypothetical protein D6722_27510, partial [Bacteroidetes bacterium]